MFITKAKVGTTNFLKLPRIFFETESAFDKHDHSDPSCAVGTINGQILIWPLAQVLPKACTRGQIMIPSYSCAAGTINGQILIWPLAQVSPQTCAMGQIRIIQLEKHGNRYVF